MLKLCPIMLLRHHTVERCPCRGVKFRNSLSLFCLKFNLCAQFVQKMCNFTVFAPVSHLGNVPTDPSLRSFFGRCKVPAKPGVAFQTGNGAIMAAPVKCRAVCCFHLLPDGSKPPAFNRLASSARMRLFHRFHVVWATKYHYKILQAQCVSEFTRP